MPIYLWLYSYTKINIYIQLHTLHTLAYYLIDTQ